MIRRLRWRSSSSCATSPASIVLPRPTSSASSRLTRGRVDRPDYRFELVVLDGDPGSERRLQRLDIRRGHRRPAHRIQKRRQPLRRVKAVGHHVRQRARGQHPATRFDLPHHLHRVAETIHALQRNHGGSLSRFDVADHPLLATHRHQRPDRGPLRGRARHQSKTVVAGPSSGTMTIDRWPAGSTPLTASLVPVALRSVVVRPRCGIATSALFAHTDLMHWTLRPEGEQEWSSSRLGDCNQPHKTATSDALH